MESVRVKVISRSLKILGLLDSKQLDMAVNQARMLTQDFPESALAHNTSVSILRKAIGHMDADNLLEECTELASRAVHLAPDCIWSWVQYCKILIEREQFEQAILELQKVPSRERAEDPHIHHVMHPERLKEHANQDDRLQHAFDQLEEMKRSLLPHHIEFVSNAPDAIERMKRANKLVQSYPADFTSLYVQAHSFLMYAHDACSTELLITAFLDKALTAANKAARAHSTSIVISLFQARIMFLLGQYNKAEIECHRGLNIDSPSDPHDDQIPFYHAIQPEGQTSAERVSHIQGKLNSLLGDISSKLEECWKTMTQCDKGKLFMPGVDDVLRYCEEKTLSSAVSALKFIKGKMKLKFWLCPIKKCNESFVTTDLLRTHLCINHNQQKVFENLSVENESCSPCEISLWKNQGGSIFLCYLGTEDEIFNTNSPYPWGKMSFEALIEEKSKNGKKFMHKLKTEMQGTENNSARIKLWRQVLDACFTDCTKFISPAVVLYQRRQLFKQMTGDTNIQKTIDKEYISSIFWATSAKETEDSSQINHLKDKEFHVYWSDKRKREYKWFPNAEQQTSVERGYNWSSDPHPSTSDVASWKPVLLDPCPQFLEVQTNWRRLIVFKDKVPGTKKPGNPVLHYAWITGLRPESPMIRCVVSEKRPIGHVNLMFKLLMRCQHDNILKPMCIWPCNGDSSWGYIVFPYFHGAISNISRNDLFIEENQVIYEFTKNGYKVLREIFSAVNYINNMHYDRGEADKIHLTLPLFPLQLSTGCVFYIKDSLGEYHALLGFFDTESTPQDMNNDLVAMVKELGIRSLNAVGDCLDTLLNGKSLDEELDHLINVLKGSSVNYDDLLWEPGCWTVGEKMTYIREIFWIQDSDVGKKSELENKPSCLGLQPFAVKLYPGWKETNLLEDFMFIRNNVLGHQEGSYNKYTGPKEDIGTKKSTVEKSLRKEAPRYMLTLVGEIRALQWPMLSPFCRSKREYNRWFENLFPQAAAAAPATSAQAPVTPASQMPQNSS